MLKGKVALITGSSRGIGKAIALKFAENGADVIINYRKSKSEAMEVAKACQAKGAAALIVQADVGKESDIIKMFNAIRKHFKRLDILVNNAGVFWLKPYLEYSSDDINKIIDIDLKGAMFCAREAAKMMAKQKSGKIINISSIAGIIGYQGAAAYCAAKAGIINFTRELSLELAPIGVNVNAVAPGAIDTDMIAFIKQNPKIKEQTLAGIPKGRLGKPEDIADACLYLASDMSDYVVGHTLVVDGGYIAK